MTILLPLLAVLLPILTLPGCFFYFDVTPKVVALLACAIAACLLPGNARALRGLASSGAGRRVMVLLGLQAVCLVIATVTSTSPWLSFSGSNWRRYGLVTGLALLVFILLTAAAIGSGRLNLRPTLRCVAVSGLVISLYTMLQYFGWDPLLPAAGYHVGEGVWTIVRPPATLGHADYLGSYLVFVVFLSGWLAAQEDHRWWRMLATIAALCAAFAIVLSGTRSAIIALLCGLVLIVIGLRPSWRVSAAFLGLSIVVMASFYYSPWGLKLRGRTRWYQEDPLGGARLLLWRDTLRMMPGHWLSGFGPETYTNEFARIESLDLARAYPDFYHESAHNIFFDELAGKGAPAALVLIIWTGLAALAAWRLLRGGTGVWLGAAFLAGTLSVQFNAFVLTTAFFWFLTSVAMLVVPTERSELSAGRWRWPVAVSGLAVAVCFGWFATRLAMADVHLERVKRLLQEGDVLGAAAGYDAVVRWQPPGVNSDLYYSRNMGARVRRQSDLMTSVKVWQETVQAGLRATRLGEDRQNAFHHMAAVYALVNDARDAESCLRSAIAAAPNWFKPHWMLAQLLEAGGRKSEARAEAALAVERDAGKHPEVLETFERLRK